MVNREKPPEQWRDDIGRSVSEYNRWFMREAPVMWSEARDRAAADAARAMEALGEFRDLSPAALRAHPRTLSVVRMSLAPKMARDRFVEFVGVKKSLVERMERNGALPRREGETEADLRRICDFALPLLDPVLFPWVAEDRSPTPDERGNALLVLGERCAGATYDPALRNAQEARQKALLREFLESHRLRESKAPAFEMPPGTFGLGRNVPIPQDEGPDRKLPCDCVVAPVDGSMPLVCIEMKSAGDFTNVNKRRKEEAEKHAALSLAYGEEVVFLLQLFGYFNSGYLKFEAIAGIDWAWDHRLDDLAAYLGI